LRPPLPLHDALPISTAVAVTLGDTEYLATTLAALAAQTRAPAHVLLVDASRDGGAQLPDDAPDTWHLIPAPGARTFGAAVRDALDRKSTRLNSSHVK